MAYSTISKPGLHFNTKLYTGNAGTNAITGVGFQPDLIWGKDRGGDRHWWADAVRGKNGTGYSLLASNNNEADTSNYPPDGVTAIGSDGFTLGANSSNSNGGWSNEINQNSGTYVTWNWKANGAGSANTSGSVNTAATSANTTAGFSICKFSYPGSGNFTIGHGLGVAPDVVILKGLGTANWQVYTSALGNTYNTQLNYSSASSTAANWWGSASPTSTVFTVGADLVESGQDGIAYCFASKKGFSKFDKYTGNGNANGTFVYTGFKAAWVMVKGTQNGVNWHMFDNKRTTFNVVNKELYADATSAEATATRMDFVSNGFKLRSSSGSENGSGNTYLYFAFAEEPLVANVGASIPATAR